MTPQEVLQGHQNNDVAHAMTGVRLKDASTFKTE